MASNGRLSGKVALVTGGGTGIGAAVARALSSEGASLALCGRRVSALKEAAAGLETPALCMECDVRSESSIQSTLLGALEEFGRLDVLVNNAGIFDRRSIEETDTAYFDDVMATNLRGAFLFCREAWASLIRSGGQIVNVSSISGTRGYAGGAAYGSSKFGLNGLSEVLAIEGRPHGIRVFSVCPGPVDTRLWRSRVQDDVADRMMKPETVADLIRWLVVLPPNVVVEKVVITNLRNPFDVSSESSET